MKLIIEGCDLSGKTTAIEKITKYYNSGITIKNNFKPKTSNNSTIYKHYHKILDLCEKLPFEDTVVLDRFFPSQLVYSYLRGFDELKQLMPREFIITNRCKDLNFVLVYLNTNLNTLEERYKIRGDEHIKLKDLKEIKSRYDTYFDRCDLNKILVDTTKKNWLEALNDDLEALSNHSNIYI